MISIKDIAREARVSHSTVSRALRNSPVVNAETSALIHSIAARRGYVASAVARSLVNQRTDTIGVVVTTIADPFAGEVIGGIEELALANDYSVILAASHSDPATRKSTAVQSFQERRVDRRADVMASRIGTQYLPMLSDMKAPIVLINSHHPGEFIYSVRIDDFAGACSAIRHLLELGHRRIAYIGDKAGFESERGPDRRIPTPSETGRGRPRFPFRNWSSIRKADLPAGSKPCPGYCNCRFLLQPCSAITTARHWGRCARFGNTVCGFRLIYQWSVLTTCFSPPTPTPH